MGKTELYIKKTEEFLESISEKMNFEVVNVEFVKEGSEHYLRVYCDMDKEGGISINDCVNISHVLNDWLDREDFIQESYILEVSSPGLGRQLKKDKDFKRENNKEVEIKLYTSLKGEKEFTGILRGFDKENIYIEKEPGKSRKLNKHNKKRANTAEAAAASREELAGENTGNLLTVRRADIALVRLKTDF